MISFLYSRIDTFVLCLDLINFNDGDRYAFIDVALRLGGWELRQQ